MRDLRILDYCRVYDASDLAPSEGGAFVLKSPIDKADLRCIAAAALGWDHVSVSRQNRPPNWAEMSFVKRIFFRDDECVMQLHVPVEDHVNCHPHCLHLFRPQHVEIPRPPAIMVGPKTEEVA